MLWIMGRGTSGTSVKDKPTLLLVEDEPLILMDMADTFQDAGFEVMEAARFDEAEELLHRHCTALDALVTDIRLGPGPDGWDLARLARKTCEDLPIVFISADSTEDWEAQGILKSVMLAKPIRSGDLIAAVQRALLD